MLGLQGGQHWPNPFATRSKIKTIRKTESLATTILGADPETRLQTPPPHRRYAFQP